MENINIEINNKDFTIHRDTMSPKHFQQLRNNLHRDIDVLESARFHSMAFKRHIWDGRTELVSLKGDLILQLGLYNKVLNLLKTYQERYAFSVNIEDLRDNQIKPKLPDKIVLDDLTLRPHQMDAVKSIFDNQIGIINQATSSGKSAEMLAIIKYSLQCLNDYEHIMVVAPNISVADQLYDNVKQYVPEVTVGKFYSGKQELNNQVIVATFQTLGRRVKQPDLKLTGSQKKLKRFVDNYVPNILKGNNYRLNLRNFIDNFQVRYKYEENDLEELEQIYNKYHSNSVIKVVLQNYESKFDKSLDKRNKKKLEDYQDVLVFLDSVSVVVCDEIQTASSDSYQNLFKKLSGLKLRAGFTGTIPKEPEKAIKIHALFGEVVSRTTNEEMQELGYTTKICIKPFTVTQPEGFNKMVEKTLAFSGSRASKDLQRYQIAYDLGIVHNDIRNKAIAKLAYNLGNSEYKHRGNGTVLILVNSIEHGEIISDLIEEFIDKNNSGVKYAFIQGETSPEERQKTFDEVRQGKLHILIATRIMDAGVSINNLKYLIYASAGKSYVQVLQRLGRLMRKDENKDKAIVIDFVDRFSSILYKHSRQRFNYYKEENFEFI